MSNKVYNESYNSTKKKLKNLLKVENPSHPPSLIFDRQEAFVNAANLYLSYIKIANSLNVCYDQMLHPQKRPIIKTLLEGAIGRALELKEELVQLEFSEIQYLDNMIGKFKLAPDDVDLLIPRHFLKEKTEEQQENSIWIQNALNKKNAEIPIKSEEESKMSSEEAVTIIQTQERARQAKEYIKCAKQRKELEEEENRKFRKEKPKPSMTEECAAILIQRIWRGYANRTAVRLKRIEEKQFLGMLLRPPKEEEKDPREIKKCIRQERHQRQEEMQKVYKSAIIKISEDIDQNVVPDMEEGMKDEIRDYFHTYKANSDDFPTFPTEEQGGSLVFFRKEIPPMVKVPAKGKKGKKGKEKKKDKKDGKKKKKEEDPGFKLKPSKYVPDVEEGIAKYEKLWKFKPKEKKKPFIFDSEQLNPLFGQQLHSEDYEEKIIRKRKMEEVQVVIRKQVDEIMRNELKILTEALEKDKGKKKKKKKKGRKGKKGKGKKGKKGKKGRKEKDLTPDRTFDSLIEELVEQGILKEYPKVHLSEIVGTYCYSGSSIRKEFNREPDPGILDIRRVVKEFCILPMGSAAIHSKGPFTKSLLLAGPHGVGKKTFVYAICTAIGATMFDLSVENIAGKYLGKPGLNMLMHLMSKVGKRLQPTVIYIQDAEKMFLKKVPKTDTTDPKRLKKNLPKFVKGISADSRIMILGTTCVPFNVDLKGLGRCYQKVLYLRHPAHGCRLVLWKEMIMNSGGILTPEFDLSTLCQISEGYTPSQMKEIVEKVLTARRKAYQERFPLTFTEFTSLLSLYQPIYNEEHEAYQVWLKKMPLGKKRAKMLKGDVDDGKGKGKKKK